MPALRHSSCQIVVTDAELHGPDGVGELLGKGQRSAVAYGLQQPLTLYQAYYNCCLPHASLRQPLSQPVPTKGTGSATMWQLYTPAMAAGLADRVGSLRDMLLYRVPPWPQPAGV
jgi:hypothetical protein